MGEEIVWPSGLAGESDLLKSFFALSTKLDVIVVKLRSNYDTVVGGSATNRSGGLGRVESRRVSADVQTQE